MRRRSVFTASAGLATALALPGRASAQGARLVGAGDPVPRLLLNNWGQAAGKDVGATLVYEATNSAEGVAKVSERRVDFGVSGAPLSPARLRDKMLVQFPFALNALAPCVNLPGVQDGALRLTAEAVADLFLGRVTRWNDAKIAESNPGAALPDLAVTPVHRAEPASPTLVFTSYLSRVSEAWRNGPRAGTSVKWPVGQEATGVDGVIKAVKATPGAVTYLGTANALAAGLARTQLRNQSGAFVRPGAASYAAAAAAADWAAPGFAADTIDVGGAGAWPILAPAFALVPTDPAADRLAGALAALRLFDWGFRGGAGEAGKLDFAPLPDAAARSVRETWAAVKGPDGKPIWGA